MRVRDDLHLHVARPGEVPLDVAVGAPESGLGLTLRRLEGGGRFTCRTNDAHPPATSTEGRFDGHRPAVGVAEVDHLLRPGQRTVRPWHRRDASVGGRLPAGYLRAHQLDRLGVRPHPGRSGRNDSPGEAQRSPPRTRSRGELRRHRSVTGRRLAFRSKGSSPSRLPRPGDKPRRRRSRA